LIYQTKTLNHLDNLLMGHHYTPTGVKSILVRNPKKKCLTSLCPVRFSVLWHVT